MDKDIRIKELDEKINALKLQIELANQKQSDLYSEQAQYIREKNTILCSDLDNYKGKYVCITVDGIADTICSYCLFDKYQIMDNGDTDIYGCWLEHSIHTPIALVRSCKTYKAGLYTIKEINKDDFKRKFYSYIEYANNVLDTNEKS